MGRSEWGFPSRPDFKNWDLRLKIDKNAGFGWRPGFFLIVVGCRPTLCRGRVTVITQVNPDKHAEEFLVLQIITTFCKMRVIPISFSDVR